jgi:lycopene cyclase domain-containing protein
MTYTILATIALMAVLIAYFVVRTKAQQTNKALLPVIAPGFALSLITVIGDNVMISSNLFSYGHDALIGAYIGQMPIEDLSYPIIAVLLVSILGGPRER